MIIVTSGSKYLDIDAYACCIAYAELLTLLGKNAQAASSAVLNESITPSLRNLPVSITREYQPTEDDEFVIVDLSNPSQFDGIVDQKRVVEVFDHHPVFEEYWSEKIREGSHIEFIGAAATLIYEQWEQAGKVASMSNATAQLLAAAILDNTLNFSASVTTDRDRRAFDAVCKKASLNGDWAANYFAECQATIEADLSQALKNDTKFIKFASFEKELCIGQLVVWDARQFVATELETIAKMLGDMRPEWFANVVSISEGCSYFVCRQEEIQHWLEGLLGINFQGGEVAKANRLWLRKEMMKVDQDSVTLASFSRQPTS